MKISFATKVATAMGLGIVLLVASEIQSYRIVQQYVQAAEDEARGQASLQMAGDLISWIDLTHAWLKGYSRSGKGSDLREYERARVRVNEILKGLRANARDPKRRADIEKLEV